MTINTLHEPEEVISQLLELNKNGKYKKNEIENIVGMNIPDKKANELSKNLRNTFVETSTGHVMLDYSAVIDFVERINNDFLKIINSNSREIIQNEFSLTDYGYDDFCTVSNNMKKVLDEAGFLDNSEEESDENNDM